MKFVVLIFMISGILFADELRNLTDKGISSYKKGDFTKAVEYFTEALEKEPTNNEARFNKGLSLGASGNAKEAEAILSTVKFNDKNASKRDNKNAEVLYTRARISEAVGDAALSNEQQPNISEAQKSYQNARALYAESLDIQKDKKSIKRTINNIEILSQKIKNLPEEQEQEQNQEQERKDSKENQDNQQESQNNNEEKQEEGEQENEQTQQNEQNENQDQQQNEQQEEQQPNKTQEENDEQTQDAIILLEHYADDAKELNRPPLQKAIPTDNGKDW